ncbi:MAG: hypothetical protein ACI8ZM_003360 [Crocinitomix sp.]|jgi:hypothetical protein
MGHRIKKINIQFVIDREPFSAKPSEMTKTRKVLKYRVTKTN